MKKVGAFLCASIIAVFALIILNHNLQSRISKNYEQRMGTVVDYRKYQGLAMQNEAAKEKDTLFILGSSEVGGSISKDPFHPSNFFEDKKDGFQVELIGRAYCQSLIHTLSIGAMGDKLKNKKVVFIVSPQWFDKKGLTLRHIKVNFSEEQFYQFMFNKNISMNLKQQVAHRILKITEKSDDMNEVKQYCKLVNNNNFIHRLARYVELPYYKARYGLLLVRDKLQSIKVMDNAKKLYFLDEGSDNFSFDWKSELNAFDKLPINNPYDFDNTMYSKVYSKEIKYMKRYTHHIDTKSAPEFMDFKLLLDTFKEVGIKPLIIDLPVNGKWYDYCGINRSERETYYNKILALVKPYNFKVLDMSKNEYIPHGFKDSSHLEWKGMEYIDEAIAKYYHEPSR